MDDVYDSLLLRAARGEITERPPVWFMRQAGRSDPEYRSLRQSISLNLEELFQTPDIAGRISLLPARWGVDALIIFLDILSPLGPMGAPFIFRPGPKPLRPLKSIQEFLTLHEFDMAEELDYVAQTFKQMRQGAGPAMPLIGFAGAPLTLLAFLAEGGSPGTQLARTRELLQTYRREMHLVLDRLANVIIQYLQFQLSSGAHIVQLFESCASLFTRSEYLEFALPYQQRIFTALRDNGTTIMFARILEDTLSLKEVTAAGADIVSLSTTRPIGEIRKEIGSSAVVQGNLDNQLLAQGPVEDILKATRACLDEGECRGHIFNLNHGILPQTPHDHITSVVDYVRAYNHTPSHFD